MISTSSWTSRYERNRTSLYIYSTLGKIFFTISFRNKYVCVFSRKFISTTFECRKCIFMLNKENKEELYHVTQSCGTLLLYVEMKLAITIISYYIFIYTGYKRCLWSMILNIAIPSFLIRSMLDKIFFIKNSK